VLDHARSGQYADHKSIVAQLTEMGGFALARTRFHEYAFLAQLDRMCRMARERWSAGPRG
jgi:hypothetical protein